MNRKERNKLEWHAEHMKRLTEWIPEAKEEWEERAAIMQHEGFMSQVEAESKAFLDVLASRKARGLSTIDRPAPRVWDLGL